MIKGKKVYGSRNGYEQGVERGREGRFKERPEELLAELVKAYNPEL